VETDRSLQAELTAKGIVFNQPGPVQFRAVLVKAGYGADAWAQLDKSRRLTKKARSRQHGRTTARSAWRWPAGCRAA
jgi:hypothetical protein